MASLRPARAPLVLLLCARALGSHPVVKLDLYRAIPAVDVGLELANVDLATLPGVLQYIHTEVIGENVHGNTNFAHTEPEARTIRLHGINSIMQAHFQIRNPDKIIEQVGSLYNWVDFGQWCQFEDGRATAAESTINDHGDFVGLQRQLDKRYPLHMPSYFTSLGGFCPNVEWKLKGTAVMPNPKCTMYRDGSGPVLGGRCPLNAVEPTGEQGCVYKYAQPTIADTVNLDRLVGIPDEDCGGRKCVDFVDWRLHCTNVTYRRRFSYSKARHGEVIRTSVCVEYDIAPACAKSCDSEACRAIPEHKREVGLPFWMGRCSAEANARRAEQVAALFGVADAPSKHNLLPARQRQDLVTCKVASEDRMCHAKGDEGGMYCSREWSGVCQPCYIPNTVKAKEDVGDALWCPWRILEHNDYRGVKDAAPMCNSTAPRDLCCIYGKSCDPEISADPASAPLDDDGYALVAHASAMAEDSEPMAVFLARVATESLKGKVLDDAGLRDQAYWEWGRAPPVGRKLAHAVAAIEPFLALPTTTTVSTTGTTTTATPLVDAAVPPPAANHDVAPAKASGGGMPWWGWVLILLALAVCCFASVAACCFLQAEEEPKQAPKKKKAQRPEQRRARDAQLPLVSASAVPVASVAPTGPASPSAVVWPAYAVSLAQPAPVAYTVRAAGVAPAPVFHARLPTGRVAAATPPASPPQVAVSTTAVPMATYSAMPTSQSVAAVAPPAPTSMPPVASLQQLPPPQQLSAHQPVTLASQQSPSAQSPPSTQVSVQAVPSARVR